MTYLRREFPIGTMLVGNFRQSVMHVHASCRLSVPVGTNLVPTPFYRHFKAVTAMTPIQYQKRLRLLKARRLLIFEPRDAAAIAFSVGYESASQFSREYARMYGLPPVRDVARFKTPASRRTAAIPLLESAELA